MGNIFGRSRKVSRITELDRQILTLKLQRDQLHIFRKKLQLQYDSAEDSAKELLREAKKVLALLALKRRREQGLLIEQTEAHLFRVNELISNVEMASVQAEVFKALEAGNSALKSLQSAVSLESVSRLVNENEDLQAGVREISEMLTVAGSEDPSLVAEFERIEAAVATELADTLPPAPENVLSDLERLPEEEKKPRTLELA